MSRVAFVADVHVANHKRFGGPAVTSLNQRCRLVIQTLRRAYEVAAERGCEAFVVLGDLFDDARPLPQMITAVADVFRGDGPEVLLLLGNHEFVSDQPGDHALGPLHNLVEIAVATPRVLRFRGRSLGLIPFRPGPVRDWLPGALEEVGGADVVGLHLGISDADTPAYLAGSSGSVDRVALAEMMDARGIGMAVAGDWHARRDWPGSRPIHQVGALCPTGWDNPGLEDYGWMGIVSGPGKFERVRIPGPRFLSASTPEDALALAREAFDAGCTPFVEVVAGPSEIAAAEEAIRTAKESGLIVDGGVVVDRAGEERTARRAAAAVRRTETLEEALAVYVGEMELAPGIDRDAVLEAARRYLG